MVYLAANGRFSFTVHHSVQSVRQLQKSGEGKGSQKLGGSQAECVRIINATRAR